MERLVVLLGIGFIVGGGAKLTNPGQAVELFASWGLPGGWLITTAGWVEVALGTAILNRPTRPLGAFGLAAWMVLWAVIQLLAGSLAAVASGVVLLLAALYLRDRLGALAPTGAWIESPLSPPPPPRLSAGLVLRVVRLVGLAFLIRWAVGGVAYWLAIPLLALPLGSGGDTNRDARVETTLLHLLVLGLGVSGLWSFVGHTFMSGTVSQSVGWAPSPFQRELAFYHLAIGGAGIACWWIRDHFWLAAAGIPSIFLFGAGWVHLADFVERGNAAPANWGFSVLFGNVIVPLVLLVLTTIRSHHLARGGTTPTPE